MASGLKISDKNLVFGQDIELSAQNREDMRSGVEKRQFLYNEYIPEPRSGKDRRSGLDSLIEGLDQEHLSSKDILN